MQTCIFVTHNRIDAYGFVKIIKTHSEACKALFVKDAQHVDRVDANYLFSILHPVYSQKGSTRVHDGLPSRFLVSRGR